MATVKEVARRAGVSVGTVSNVLTGAVPVSAKRRGRVLTAIRELGFQPNQVARSLKLRRTRTIGLIISDITNPFFSQLARGAEDAAIKRQYMLLIFNTDDRIERERQALGVLRERQVDGILLVVAPGDADYSHISNTIAQGTPVVCLDRLPPKITVDSVTVDNIRAAQGCVQHLIDTGHRKIAILAGSVVLQTARQRLEGYKRALTGAGLPIRNEYVRQGEFRASSGYELGKSLLCSADRPTALFCSNGMMAMGVLKAIEELGLRCPGDIAIAVFDDLPSSDVIRPHLTSVAQPAYWVGHRGAELLIHRIQKSGGSKRIKIVLPTELKIRESTIGSGSMGRRLR